MLVNRIPASTFIAFLVITGNKYSGKNKLCPIKKKPTHKAKSAIAHIAFLPTLTEKMKFETDKMNLK